MKPLIPFITALLISSTCFATTSTLYMSYGGLTRDFIVHLPTGYVQGQHLPVVLNFHGYTSNAAEQELYSGMDNTADQNNFIVVYPDGISNSWNVGWTGAYGTGVDDVGFTGKIIDTLIQLYGIDTNRVYSTGLSNGGFLSHRLACEMSSRIAAIAAVSGTLTDSTAYYCNPQRLMPIMHIHGTADPIVPYNGLTGSLSTEQTINFWLARETCSTPGDTTNVPDTNTGDGSTVQKIDYIHCSASNEVLFYKITGGGHTWPGGTLTISQFGNTNRDIDASQEIWNFFNRYTLSGPTGITEQAQNQTTINLYPNPATSDLKIESTVEIDRAELINVLGQVVLSKQINAANATINLSDIAGGIYFVKMYSGGFSITRKICKN